MHMFVGITIICNSGHSTPIKSLTFSGEVFTWNLKHRWVLLVPLQQSRDSDLVDRDISEKYSQMSHISKLLRITTYFHCDNIVVNTRGCNYFINILCF